MFITMCSYMCNIQNISSKKIYEYMINNIIRYASYILNMIDNLAMNDLLVWTELLNIILLFLLLLSQPNYYFSTTTYINNEK